MHPSPLHERLAAVAGPRSSRQIGDLTGTNHETVRRYLAGGAPSVEFLQAFCRAFGVSGEWLLTGRGPMRAGDIRHHALRDADPADLLAALTASVEALVTRVDRLERFVQVLDVRVRGLAHLQEHPDGHAPSPELGPGARRATPISPPERVLRLRDALARRPHEDDR